MDLPLRSGFSADQLKGVNFDALRSDLFGSSTGVDKSSGLSKDIHTNGSLKGGVRSAKFNGYQGSHNLTETVASSLSVSADSVTPIAIVGMSCRFPDGVSDIDKFWNLVSEGRSAWSEIPESRFNPDGFYHPNSDRTDSMNVKSGHFLQGTEHTHFDASFFNMSPNEAKATDPGARMHLEGAYEALENAGINVSEIIGSDTAVFVGGFNSDYEGLMARDPGISPAYKVTGVKPSLFSNRISHFFDLRGRSITLDTACSSSVVALHLACECLRKGESKMAIVSGANLIIDPDIMMALSTMKFLSPEGKSYMFDQGANGYARGEGIATLVVKRLSDALEANDPIHAIIRNTRTNQDGKTPGITMPSQDAQRALILATY